MPLKRKPAARFGSTIGGKRKSFARAHLRHLQSRRARQQGASFQKFLNELSQQCALKATTAPGDARRFAHAAIATGYDVIAAAGGDGTVNESSTASATSRMVSPKHGSACCRSAR